MDWKWNLRGDLDTDSFDMVRVWKDWINGNSGTVVIK